MDNSPILPQPNDSNHLNAMSCLTEYKQVAIIILFIYLFFLFPFSAMAINLMVLKTITINTHLYLMPIHAVRTS